ncbi:hypothetical protein [Paraburkholderia sp. ZP32-5]|uniref:hypothetical protein n=1 Tax=Paraburkholderia sp. ZP32-5 TaxID=2883245 RepID=UPI001F4341A8|nr:hypothetical protein [Paraburkholderia sp. ZP32-5]
MRKTVAYVLVTVAMLLGATTARADNPTTECKRLDEKQAEWISGGFYEGSFEDGTPFQMNLFQPPPAAVENEMPAEGLQSEYWYPRHRRRAKLHLEVSVSGEAGLLIRTMGIVQWPHITDDKESDSGKSTSETFTATHSKDWAEIEGVWSSDTLHKEMHFHMTRAFSYRTSVYSFLTDDSIQLWDSRRSINVRTYPIMDDSMHGPKRAALHTLLDKLNDSAAESYCDVQDSSTLAAEWASADFLFLTKLSNEYRLGAAHGIGDLYSISHYELRDGQYEQVYLDSFYEPSLACENQLFDQMVVGLVADQAAQPENAYTVFPGRNLANSTSHGEHDIVLRDDIPQDYLVTPEGIEFYTDPYALGSYMDNHRIFIEKRQIANCVKALPQYKPFL